MKIFGKIHDLLSSLLGFKKASLEAESEPYVKLGVDKINLLLAKYECEDEDELMIALSLRDHEVDNFTEDELIFFNDPELSFLRNIAQLSSTLYNENLYGRSLAIRELVSNPSNSQILSNPNNPFKEVIDFTLKYFKKYFDKSPMEADNLLQQLFPNMHPFIKRAIFNQCHDIELEIQLDEQIEFDAFLFFCKNTLLNMFPNKKLRDEEIRRNFKVIDNSLISFIENDQNE